MVGLQITWGAIFEKFLWKKKKSTKKLITQKYLWASIKKKSIVQICLGSPDHHDHTHEGVSRHSMGGWGRRVGSSPPNLASNFGYCNILKGGVKLTSRPHLKKKKRSFLIYKGKHAPPFHSCWVAVLWGWWHNIDDGWGGLTPPPAPHSHPLSQAQPFCGAY